MTAICFVYEVWRESEPLPHLARYGPWALVTGASEGLGAAAAREVASAGVHVVLAARRADRLQQVAEDLSRAYSVHTQVVAVDLADPHGPARLLDAIGERDIGLAILAAGFGSSGPFLGAARSGEEAMVDCNCRAVVSLAHALGARMVARGSGGLVLFSSIVAFQGVPNAVTYAATKAFVQTLGEGLARELRPQGVDVLVAAPGPVASGFAARAGMTMAGAASAGPVARGMLAALGRGTLVRPGALAKLLGWSLALLPRSARSLVMGRIMAGMAGA